MDDLRKQYPVGTKVVYMFGGCRPGTVVGHQVHIGAVLVRLHDGTVPVKPVYLQKEAQ